MKFLQQIVLLLVCDPIKYLLLASIGTPPQAFYGNDPLTNVIVISDPDLAALASIKQLVETTNAFPILTYKHHND